MDTSYQLAEGERSYLNAILNALRKPHVMLDENLRVQSANSAFSRLFPNGSEEPEGRFFFDVGLGVWDVPALRNLLEHISADGGADAFEIPIGERAMLVFARQLPSVETAGRQILLTIEDITERRRLEDELRSDAEFGRRVLRSIRDWVKVLDLDANLLSMNEAGQQIFGIDDIRPLLRTSWIQLWREGPERDAARAAVATAREGGEGHFEGYLATSGGEPRWWDVRVTLMPPAWGQPGQLLAVSRDITDRRRHEEQLQAAHQELLRIGSELKRSNEDLDQFARIASHDLRAPLQNISNLLQLFVSKYNSKVDAEGREILSLARGAADRMSALTVNLLRFAEVGQASMEPAPVSSQAVLAGALENLQARIEECPAVITADPLPVVRVNETHLLQLFQNLVGNGIKYAREDAKPRVHISVEHKGRYFVFAVKDNGQGIQQRYLETIFEPFKRLHGQEVSGSGLGLAVCKKIVERAGGIIWAQSEPGQGSTFFFTLPAAEAEQSVTA